MSANSPHIYTLVRSLSRTEKAYFKKFGFKYDKDNKAEFALFDLIDRALKKVDGIADEIDTVCAKKYKKLGLKESFTSNKSKLYQAILTALQSYEKSKNVEEKIFEYYRLGSILLDRNMLKEAKSYYQKAQNLATEHEHFELVQLTNLSLAKLGTRLNNTNLTQYVTLAQAASEKQIELIQMETVYFELATLQKKIGTIRNDDHQESLNNIIATTDLSKSTSSLKSEVFRLNSLSTIALLHGDQAKSFQTFAEIIKLYAGNENFKASNLRKYIIYLEHYLQTALLSFNFSEYNRVIQILQQLETTNQHEQTWKETALILIESIHAILQRQPENYSKLSIRFKDLYTNHWVFVPDYRKISIAYYMVTGFFMLDDYEAVKEWWSFINQFKHIDIRYDVSASTTIMHWIALYKSIDHYYLSNLLEATNKMWYNRNYNFELERYILKMMQTLLETPKSEVVAFLELQLHEIKKIIESPKEATFLNVFDIVAWIESELNQESFANKWFARNLPAT